MKRKKILKIVHHQKKEKKNHFFVDPQKLPLAPSSNEEKRK